MKTVYGAAGFALGASAAILPRQQCCFSLTASGGQSGAVTQLDDGQNRIGAGSGSGSGSGAQYCINNGKITDGQGRGCILTPPTTQFQCDAGASPTSGFSVNGNGELEYNGSTTFYACAASDTEYNIYTSTSDAQTKCSEITLNTGGECAGYGNGNGSPSGTGAASQPAGSTGTAPAGSATVPGGHSSAPGNTGAPSSPAASAYSSMSVPGGKTSQASATDYSSAPGNSKSAPLMSQPTAKTSQASAPGYSSAHGGGNSKSAPMMSQPASKTSEGSAPGYTAASNTAPQSNGGASTPAGSAPAASTPATGTQQAGNGKACQTALTGAYQTPHLIVPVSSESPDTAYGTSYFGQINSTTSTIFNFDIPQSYAGKQCSLVFLFPEKADLVTSDYTFSESGSIHFTQLKSAADMQTSYNNAPGVQSDLGSVAVRPGNSYVMDSSACQAGTTESIELSSEGGLALNFFEDYNPSPIGLYITSC